MTVQQHSENEWTAGGWSASAPDGNYHDVIRIFADNDPEGATPVAICPQRQSAIMSVLSGKTNENTEAACNARLIAAAPDLFEALQWALDELNGRTRYDEDVADQQIENCYRLAESALAKAVSK